MEFSEEKKKKIEAEIVDICISALESNAMSEQDMGDISFFVLERIDTIKNHEELIEFLEKLSLKWNVFGSLLEIEKGKMGMSQDKNAANDVEQLIKNGNIDEALKVAKSANEGGGA